jgi:hypothetical protein
MFVRSLAAVGLPIPKTIDHALSKVRSFPSIGSDMIVQLCFSDQEYLGLSRVHKMISGSILDPDCHKSGAALFQWMLEIQGLYLLETLPPVATILEDGVSYILNAERAVFVSSSLFDTKTGEIMATPPVVLPIN